MNSGISDALSGINDPQLRQFIEGETHRQKFQVLVRELTERCWDSCMVDKPSTRLDSRTQTCLTNCVERFLDTSNFIINRMERVSGASMPAPPSDLMI